MDKTMILLGLGAVVVLIILVLFMRGELRFSANDLSSGHYNQLFGNLDEDKHKVYTSSPYTKKGSLGFLDDDEEAGENPEYSEVADKNSPADLPEVEKTEEGVSVVPDKVKPLGANKNFSNPYSMNRDKIIKGSSHMHHIDGKWANEEDVQQLNVSFGQAKSLGGDLRHHRTHLGN
tara:strand:+ start:1470 stop:1997 length:528 start_codon:yes stop_codon:yes gene_type:complete